MAYLGERIKNIWMKNQWGLAAMGIAWLIFFSPILVGGRVWFLDDLKDIYYPLEHVYQQFQRAWELPVWSQEFGFGHPLLAWGQLGFFAPIHVILRFFSIHPVWLLQASMMIYFLFGLLGMFSFLRARHFSPPASALGALVFVFNGFMVAHIVHVNFYTATMFLPLLLLAIDAFAKQPNWRRAALMALAAAAITVSGQPQVVLLTLGIAALFGLMLVGAAVRQHTRRGKYARSVALYTVLAGLLALGLSSLAILPLMEFLPSTDRSGDLPTSELYEFSYPPSHAITLIFPFHFGDYDTYWGAKGFQELSGYVGILPLVLAVASLTAGKRHGPERAAAILLILIAVAFGLGKYSPLYRWLVERHILTNLTVPGRFIYFLDVGIAVLAAIGLDGALRFIRSHRKIYQITQWTVVVLTGATLLVFGVQYIPTTDRQAALARSPFAEELTDYRTRQGILPRFYSQERLLTGGSDERSIFLTDSISPLFTIYQPLSAEEVRDCLVIKATADLASNGTVTAALLPALGEPPLATQSISADTVRRHSDIQLCFQKEEPLSFDTNELVLAFSAGSPSGIRLYYQPLAEGRSLYFVRVMSPTSDQLRQSQKQARLVYSTVSQHAHNLDQALLTRHLQATAGASSARWIGALSIRSYREFIDAFFANDLEEVIDGGGLHAIERNRKLLDLSGVTHLAQYLPPRATDTMPAAGFEARGEAPAADGLVRLYENPAAYPKTFVVPNGKFLAAADETRHAMMDLLFNPRELVYISGPSPPDIPAPVSEPLHASSTIFEYHPTSIKVKVTTNREAFLVVTDSTTPEWRTYVDDQPSLYLVANSVFKVAQVPAGEHIVSFRYESRAIELSKRLTIASGLIIVALFVLDKLVKLRKQAKRSPVVKQ